MFQDILRFSFGNTESFYYLGNRSIVDVDLITESIQQTKLKPSPTCGIDFNFLFNCVPD